MKKFIYILGIFLIIAGCKKNGVQPKGYAGTWELKQKSGGIAGTTITYPSNEGNILMLNADSTYKRFVKYQQSSEGPYHIVKNGVNWANKTYDGIYFNTDTRADFIILNGNELTIGNTFPDGVTLLYERRN